MDRYRNDGLLFDVSDAGPPDGDAAVLLHGWPQDHTAWRRVVPLLTGAGLRTLAPDLRGTSPGARPRERAAYRMPALVGDVTALLDAAGLDRAHVVGHDWGGALAWAVAARHPDRVASLTVLSTPHPAAMSEALRHRDQAARSWYMFFFQLPVLPEVLLAPTLPRQLRGMGLPEEDARRYAARFREPGAATGGLNWYRALLSGMLRPGGTKPAGAGGSRVTVPTTFLWGTRDPALGRRAAELTAGHVAGDYRFVETDAGHWLPELCPEDVAREVLARAR